MTVYYSRPKLKSLAQGDRLAFVRQFRRMSQQELGEKIGMPPKNARRLIGRIETHNRDITPERLNRISQALGVNAAMLKRWDYTDPSDLFYELLWIEELCYGFTLRNANSRQPGNHTHKYLLEHYAEWLKMRKKYAGGHISYEEYWEWKLSIR